MSLSPLFVFLSVIVWGWLWGIAGALMAVPIVTSLKVICDHVPGLRPVGDFVKGNGRVGGAEETPELEFPPGESRVRPDSGL